MPQARGQISKVRRAQNACAGGKVSVFIICRNFYAEHKNSGGAMPTNASPAVAAGLNFRGCFGFCSRDNIAGEMNGTLRVSIDSAGLTASDFLAKRALCHEIVR